MINKMILPILGNLFTIVIISISTASMILALYVGFNLIDASFVKLRKKDNKLKLKNSAI